MQDTFQPCQTKGKEMLISMCQTGLLKGSSWYMCKIRLTSIIASWTELHEGKKQAEHIFFGSFTAVGQWVGPKYQTWLHIRLYIAIASNAGQHGHPCLLSARKHLRWPARFKGQCIKYLSHMQGSHILQVPHGYLLKDTNLYHLTIGNKGIKVSKHPSVQILHIDITWHIL